MTLFDTAEGYGPFTNEELFGEALRPVRDEVLVCTKYGFKIDDQGQFVKAQEIYVPDLYIKMLKVTSRNFQ